MAVGVPVDVQAGEARKRPGELGEGDQQISDGDVGAEPSCRMGTVDETLDDPFEPVAFGEQVGMVLVEVDASGEHRAQGADPLVGGRVGEAAQRDEGSDSPAAASSARSAVPPRTARTTSWTRAARSAKFR